MVLNHSTLQGLFLRRKKENVEFQRASASLAPPLFYIVFLGVFLRPAKLVENANPILRKVLD